MNTQQVLALSPATLELTRALYRKTGLIGRWHLQARTIKTICQIGAANEPGAIRELMPFGISQNGDVRTAARDNIGHLFSLVPVEALPVVDEWLRQSWPDWEDWHALRPETVRILRPNTQIDRIFLGLMASHRSGFVREQAIRILGLEESECIVPFLLIRLVDWVNQVREAAEAEVVKRIESRHAKILVDCLALLDRLADTTRFNRSILQCVDELLKSPECTGELQRGMQHPSRGVRRHCFRVAARAPRLPVADVVAQAVRDQDVVVRRWAFAAGAELPPDDRIALREQAARDSYPPIRRLAFRDLAEDSGSSLSDFEFFLLDRSAPIRRECQAAVAKRFAFSPANFYRAQLQASHARQIEAAVLGIAETGGPEAAADIVGLLDHRSARVRRAVIRATRAVGAKLSSVVLLNKIASDRPSVAREAALALLAERTVAAEQIWGEAKKNPDHHVRTASLNVLRTASKWAQVRIFLDATGDSEPSVSCRAAELLAVWAHRFNVNFTQPTAEDKLALSNALAKLPDVLPRALSRELTFLIETSLR